MNHKKLLTYKGKTGGKEIYKCFMIIGGKGQGKSTKAKELMSEYFDAFIPHLSQWNIQPRGFIHDYNGGITFQSIPTLEQYLEALNKRLRRNGKKEIKLDNIFDLFNAKFDDGTLVWDRGILRFVTNDNDEIREMHENLYRKFRNGFIVFDECGNYMDGSLPSWQKKICTNIRHMSCYAAYIFHQINSVPPYFGRSDHFFKIFLFKTKEILNYNKLESRFSCASELFEAAKKVRKYPRIDAWMQTHEEVIV